MQLRDKNPEYNLSFSLRDVIVFCGLTAVISIMTTFACQQSWRYALGHEYIRPSSVEEALDRDAILLDEVRRDNQLSQKALDALQGDVNKAKVNSRCSSARS
jgi:hypothetical protein